MWFSSIVSSPRGSLLPHQTLELANVYLENAFDAKDSNIALVLCHDTEAALYQARKASKHDKNPTVTKGIATAYISLGKLLESRGHVSGAEVSFEKAKNLGENVHGLTQPPDTYRPSKIMGTLDSDRGSQNAGSAESSVLDQRQISIVFTIASTIPVHIFDKNVPPSAVEMKLPEPDARLDNTLQLVCSLGLLKIAQSANFKLEPIALKWMESIKKEKDEEKRLHDIAADIIRTFKKEKIKDAKVVAEVVCLAPILDKGTFFDLLGEFYSAVDRSGLLKFQELEGLAQLIQGVDRSYLSAEDLIKILQLLSTRLKDTHQEPSQHMYRLTMAVSNVLDAMADTKVTNLDRVKLHEPLSSYLSELRRSSDPFLKYQAAYAHQALLNVPDDETKSQAFTRRTLQVIRGVSGLASIVNGVDPTKIVNGLKDILKGISGESELSDVFDAVKSTCGKVSSLIEEGKGSMDALTEGLKFGRKLAWYPALREADVMIRDGEFHTFKKLICEAPCRYDPAFQWGVCQRLGEIAANPKWDEKTRRNAVAFLGEIYKNDKVWRLKDDVKKWILNILMQLSSSSGESSQLHSAAAKTLFRELEVSDDIKKRALYRECRDNGPIAYPLKVDLPELASPSLLHRVQNIPDVEGHLRILKKQRTKERGHAVYIAPQAKSSFKAADDTGFPLMNQVKEFLKSEQKVFLIMGDSGAGKSIFSRELEYDLWNSYQSKEDRIPLHINLPTIDRPEIDMIAKQLKRDEFTDPQIRELKHNRSFILICDGYDESQQTHNLYMSNRLNQSNEWKAQMVISCRSEHLGSDYRDRFQPVDRNQQSVSPLFQEAVITPFSTIQIDEYIDGYVSAKRPLWRVEDYKQALNLIPSLKDLVKNPFLMTLSLEVLPRMVDPGKNLSTTRVTRVILYDHFVEQWLEREKKRLLEKDLTGQAKAAFDRLSAEGFIPNGIEYLKRLAVAIYKEQDGHPVVVYSQLIDEGSWKDLLFNQDHKQILLEVSPVKRNGNQHRFIHRSLLEYGLTRAIFDPQDKRNQNTSVPRQRKLKSTVEELVTQQEPDSNSPLVWRSFMHDHSLLHFLEERVQQEQVFKEQLIGYIKHSRRDPKWSTAAGNAITILVRAGVLDRELFRDLFNAFCSGIDHSDLLDFHQLEGVALLMQGAGQDHLEADDLIRILELLSSRLSGTRQQSAKDLYQLALAVSHLLDAMADTEVADLDHERLHESLSKYLDRLKGSDDPYLVYQSAYAYQALLCVPDNKTVWKSAMRRSEKMVQSVSGFVGTAKGLDLTVFIEGLQDIQGGLAGVSETDHVARGVYDNVIPLFQSGQRVMECLQEGQSFGSKRDWYSALRGADTLIHNGELGTFKKLVCDVPCQHNAAFQWGLCQRLGEIAANPTWDASSRQSAIAFLGEIYQDDEVWGQQAVVKQWVLNILMQLTTPSESALECKSYTHGSDINDLVILSVGRGELIELADSFLIHLAQVTITESLLQKLEECGDEKKRELYRACRMGGPIDYPLKVILPEFASPLDLDRQQNRSNIEENLRTLRTQRTNRGNSVYIPPQAKSSLQAVDDTRFSLMDKVKEFMESDQKVFLILGDSGTGKSMFSRELEFDLWQSYENKKGIIPLHINLSSIDKPEHDMIAKQLRRYEFTEPQIREMKVNRMFILICDGYDDSRQTHNLYMSNRLNQPGEWTAQMVISYRSEYLGSDYQERFQPGDRNQQPDSALLQEAVITPFSIDQIQDYIRQYISIHQPLWSEGDYKQALKLIPSLMDLMRNPFMMTLSLEALPRIVDPGQHLSSARITRVALYDHFVEQWLERNAKRLGEKELSPETREAFEKLSAEGFILNGIEYLKMFSTAIYKEQGGQPIVEYTQLIDRGSWKDAFFSSREMQLLLEVLPLTRIGNQHRFIHRSFLEYGLARAVFDPQDRKSRAALEPILGRRGSVSSTLSFEINADLDSSEQDPNPNSPLAWRSFVNDYSLLQFLEERVQQEPVFKEQLFVYIEHSKKNKKWHKAAANAITILVRAGEQFIGTDLRGIRIPGADLSYGVFHSVQLQEADMRKVDLRGAWLWQTDLSRTDMTGVQFGELPYLAVDSAVHSCAFSPYGWSLAIGLDRGNINVYSTARWDMIQSLNGHSDSVSSVAYSPDGNLIVSGSRDKTVRLWETGHGICQHILSDHTDKVHCVAYSPYGDQVASASDDKTIRLWDPATGDCCHILSGHRNSVLCVVYSPRGDQISSGGDDCTVRLWNAVTGECSRMFVGHSDVIWGIAFSPQGDQVASASKDNTIRQWDVESGDCPNILEGHTNEVLNVVYSPQGGQIASGSQDGSVRVWDVQSGSCRYTLTGHGMGVSCVAFSPKGDMVASGSLDETVRLWDVSAGGSRRILNGHSQAVYDVQCSPQGHLIASCSSDHTIRLLDAETGICLRSLSGHSSPVFNVAFSSRGGQIVSGSADNTVRVWNVETGNCQGILAGHTATVLSIAYSPQGDQVASASYDDTVRLWNATTGEHGGSLHGHTDGVTSIDYSPDNSLIATGSSEGTARLWNVGTMACIKTLIGHESSIQDITFSPQGDQLASASDDRTVRLWSVETGDCCLVLNGHGQEVLSVAYSPRGDLLASGSWDSTVRLWDVGSGQCRATIQNLQGGVKGIAWIPSTDANYLVTGCGDGSVLKWQVTEEEEQLYITLCWGATSGTLTVTGTSIQDVRGLTASNQQLLKQRGVVGESSNRLREASKKIMTMASVASRFRLLSERKVIDSGMSTDTSNGQSRQSEQPDER